MALIRDNFDRENLGAEWDQVSGSWTIVDSSYLTHNGNNDGQDRVIHTHVFNSTNQSCEINSIHNPGNNFDGFYPCINYDPNNDSFYRFFFRGDVGSLQQVIGRSTIFLAGITGSGSRPPHILKISREGNTLKGFVDGVLRAEHELVDNFQTGTRAGISGKKVRAGWFEADDIVLASTTPTLTAKITGITATSAVPVIDVTF